MARHFAFEIGFASLCRSFVVKPHGRWAWAGMMTLSYGLRIGSVRGFGFDLLSIANNTLQITFHDRGLAKGRTCVALIPGVTFPSRADFVTDLGQQFADADQVLALDFERLFLERPAGAAGGFEPIK